MMCIPKFSCCWSKGHNTTAATDISFPDPESIEKQDPSSYESVTTSDGIKIEGTKKAGIQDDVKLAFSKKFFTWALLHETPHETYVIPLTPDGSMAGSTRTYAVIIHNDNQANKGTTVSVDIPAELHDQVMGENFI